MKRADEQSIFFGAALLAEIAARGRGIQKKLAEQTGISVGMICDIKRGRTGCSLEKRQALAEALGYNYGDFIAKGRELERDKLKKPMAADSSGDSMRDEKSRLIIRNLKRQKELFRHRASVLALKLIAMQEKQIAAQEAYITAQNEIMRLSRENENLRHAPQNPESLCDPLVRGGRTAPAIGANKAISLRYKFSIGCRQGNCGNPSAGIL